METNHPAVTLSTIAALGASIGVFQVLASGEKVTVWRALGRAGITAGFALAGQALLVVIPGMSLEASVGIAALLASLGASGIERLATRVIGPKGPTA
jgi:hypothetical protein